MAYPYPKDDGDGGCLLLLAIVIAFVMLMFRVDRALTIYERTHACPCEIEEVTDGH